MSNSQPYVFIFDLDNTLTDTNSIKKQYLSGGSLFNENPYSIIKIDRKLQFLLNKIKNKKIIFSNAMSSHVINVTNALGITHFFNKIIDRGITNTLKPNLNSYIITMQLAKLYDFKKCIFFDE